MNVKKALQIQQILDGRAIPSDMFDEHLVYYSKSRDRWINIVDMDIAHLVRAFAKVYDQIKHIDGNLHDPQTLEKKVAQDEALADYNKMILAKISNILEK